MHTRQGLCNLSAIRFVANETKKTDRVQKSTDKEDLPPAEIYSCRTSRSEYFPYTGADPVRPLVPHLKDYSPPEPIRFQAGARRPGSCDWQDEEIQWIPRRTQLSTCA